MDTLTLEKEAWRLYYKLSNMAYSHSLFELGNPELKKSRYRLIKLTNRAFDRWVRRENKHFNYNPGGFAPSSALSSGVVGQGTLS